MNLRIIDSLPDGLLTWQLLIMFISYAITIYIIANSAKDIESFNSQFSLATAAMILTGVIGLVFLVSQ